jgi:hypothetical protein
MMLERTLCGLEITRSWERSSSAPYRHRCRCSRAFSSEPVCHRCSCVKCTEARAEWDRHIKAGGIAGEERRRRGESSG